MQLLVLLLTFLLLKDILKNLYETWKLHSCLVSRRETHFGATLFFHRIPWRKGTLGQKFGDNCLCHWELFRNTELP